MIDSSNPLHLNEREEFVIKQNRENIEKAREQKDVKKVFDLACQSTAIINRANLQALQDVQNIEDEEEFYFSESPETFPDAPLQGFVLRMHLLTNSELSNKIIALLQEWQNNND